MSTTNFNILVNFCENVYSADLPINEAWYGTTLAHFAVQHQGWELSDADAEKYDVVSFADAPDNIDLKTKYPTGLVIINIPPDMIDKVGMQKYGASRPGRIIGYNPDKRYALVIFQRSLYEDIYQNLYSYKYLSALTNDLYEKGVYHTVSSLKKNLSVSTKLVFTSSQTTLQGKQLLAQGGSKDNPDNILLEIKSDTTNRRLPEVERVEIWCTPTFDSDKKMDRFDFTRHDVPVIDIIASIKSYAQSYNDKIADAIPVKTGLELIKNALSNYPGTSTRTPDGDLQIKYINDTQFNSIQDLLGTDYRQDSNIEQLRAVIPDTVTAPKSAPNTMWVSLYKDVKTAKNFLVVGIEEYSRSNLVSDILSSSSKIYKMLGKIAEDKNKISEETREFMAAFNSLTKPGKELFLRYLSHRNA